MPRPRLLIALLVLATVLVDAVVWSIWASGAWIRITQPDFVVLFVWPLMLAQTSLLAVWAVCGGNWTPWIPVILVGTITWWQRLIDEPEGAAVVVLLLQAAAIVAGLGLARIFGIRVVPERHDALSPETELDGARMQFSLRYLFSWTTAVALSLGLLSYCVEYGTIVPLLLREWRPALALSLGVAAVAFAALWTVLGTKWSPLRIAALFLITLGTIIVWGNAAEYRPRWETLTVVVLGQTFWLLVSLFVVRVAGYRLVRRGAGGGT